jgi:formate/nitrite transporter FocA (FNT family)
MISEAESQEKVKESTSIDAEGIHEVVRKEGLRELDRPTSALAWSGFAAGLSMGFSFLAEGLLRSHLPEADWRPLIAKLGYTVGFLIVILGNQQLFTENTLTPIVPLLHEWTTRRLRDVLRLWGAVLITNLIGALLFAFALGRLDVVEPRVMHALTGIAQETLQHSAMVTMLHAVFAGWLIALMVWILPGAESSKALVIIVLAYLVGIGGFAHIIAGATEVFYAGVRAEREWSEIILGFILPTLAGNILGGLTLVAGINHAQAQSGK